MKSKGFKIVVGLLAAVIVVLGGLLAAKSLAPASGASEAPEGAVVSAGSVADDSSLPLPPGGVEVIDGSANGEAA